MTQKEIRKYAQRIYEKSEIGSEIERAAEYILDLLIQAHNPEMIVENVVKKIEELRRDDEDTSAWDEILSAILE
jgi:hypothetical protein